MPESQSAPGTPGTPLRVGLSVKLVLSCPSALRVGRSQMEVCGQDEMSVQPYMRFVPSTGSWTPSQETTRSLNITFAVV